MYDIETINRHHPVIAAGQTIKSITTCTYSEWPESFQVGVDGVTRIEATIKAGMHSDIAYVRVWKGDVAVAEFCQHNIIGVYFEEARNG